MHVIGRYTRVRGYGYGQPFAGLSAPYIWDKARHTLLPHRHQDWEYLADMGIYVPSVHGGAWGGAAAYPRTYMGSTGTVTGTATSVAMSNAYTHASAGNSTGGRLRLHTARTLTNIYFFISSFSGVGVLADNLVAEFRNTTSNLPGTTLHASGTNAHGGTAGWQNVSGLSFAASADTDYWAVVGCPTLDATNFANVLSRHTAFDAFDALVGDRMAADTTNGWTAGTLRANAMQVLCHFSADNVTLGNPYTAVANSTSDTNRRGMYIGGFVESIQLLGLVNPVGNASISGLELYLSTAATPGTGQSATGAYQLYQAGASTPSGYFFDSVQTLAKATAYRCVFTYSGATTFPRKISIGTGSSSAIRRAGLALGDFYWAGANGTTNWSNDDVDGLPQALLVLADQVEIAAGGSTKHSGTGMFRHVTHRSG